MKKLIYSSLFLICLFGGFNNIFAQDPTITVTAPNGSEVWQRGKTHIITWTDNLTVNVKIQLYKGGSLYSTIKANTSQNSFSWYITPNTVPGDDYKVRISALNNPGIYDESDDFFTICAGTPGGHIDVTSPAGGETWLRGTTHQITWTDNVTENLKILLCDVSGNPLSIIKASISGNSFNWYISKAIVGGFYKIKLVSTLDENIVGLSNSFNINDGTSPSITVSSPNGGEKWNRNSTYTIRWNDNISSNVKIELIHGTASPTLVAASVSGTSYPWLIPGTTDPDVNYKIKISDVSDPAISDQSNNPFTILDATVTPTVTVTYPSDAGISWKRGSAYTITWDQNFASNVKIECFDGTTTPTIIKSSISGSSFTWPIPNGFALGTNYKIRVTKLTDPTCTDESNNPFTIYAGTLTGTITVDHPNGETWQRGQTHLVQWTDNLSENVKVELYDLSYTFLYTIKTSTGLNSCSWYIPSNQAKGDYVVRVTSLANSTIKGEGIVHVSLSNPQGYITITAPNGDSWVRGQAHLIEWADNLTENVKIELTNTGGTVTTTIIKNSTPGASYSWYIPKLTEPRSDYRIKITSLLDPDIYALSNEFTIFAAVKDFMVYPNPAGPVLNMNFEELNFNTYTVEIFDRYGTRVYYKPMDSESTNNLTLSTGNFRSDVYMVVVSSGEDRISKKVIIQH
ncbi:MAG: T9SS type A sorting domain-containing protein [Bacteroidales bacterium]|nr:T9SS type A sorting domain-containing protein [Bacteroidales bacterium]